MLKLIMVGVWVAIVTLGSVYLSIEMSKPADPAAEEAKKKAVQELVKGEVVTFPVISGDHVEGYFLTRISYIADKTKLAEITLPIPEVLTDELYTALVGDRVIRIADTRNFDLEALRKRVTTAINTRLGSEVVIGLIFEQIDYLSKEDIRASVADKHLSMKDGSKIVEEKIPEDLADKAAPAAAH